MGTIGWIAVGVATGLLANMLFPGKRSRGLIFTALTGITAVLDGDWTASMFRTHGLASFPGWLAALAETAVLLLACYLFTRPSQPSRRADSPLGNARPLAANRHRWPCPGGDRVTQSGPAGLPLEGQPPGLPTRLTTQLPPGHRRSGPWRYIDQPDRDVPSRSPAVPSSDSFPVPARQPARPNER
jgi:uncharacterized membrane protein YeaQ/YmgE (transglycosylase-associated protein family)